MTAPTSPQPAAPPPLTETDVRVIAWRVVDINAEHRRAQLADKLDRIAVVAYLVSLAAFVVYLIARAIASRLDP